MAKIEMVGVEEYLELLITTEIQTRNMLGRSIYPGAKIVSDECKRRLKNLQTDDSLFKFHPYRSGPTSRQKKALIQSMGIAQMRVRGGEYDVKLGFDGYNDIPANFPTNKIKYQPNAAIARSVNKGTSFMKPQPFMDLTISTKKAEVEKAIGEQFDKELEKYWERQDHKF